MLAVDGLLNVLSADDNEKDYENRNNDHDFSEVLKFCGDSKTQAQTVRYANGEEKNFSFDK